MPAHPLLPTPDDGCETSTSKVQSELELKTADLLFPWIVDGSISSHDDDGSDHQPSFTPIESLKLDRDLHAQFLRDGLYKLPTSFVGLDAARGWLIYWILNSLSMLGHNFTSAEKNQAIETILSFQNPTTSAFGGGPGQCAHLAATLAAVWALCIVLSQPSPEDPPGLVDQTWARIDRQKLHGWLLSLKDPRSGGVHIQVGGEIDVRATYAALVVAGLFNLMTPDLMDGLADYLVKTQNYEGGLAATADSVGYGSSVPIGEAHGGYASCSLAAHFSLRAFHPTRLDLDGCLRWAVHTQTTPINGGGFRGRTNKLVDGCYSWWTGSMFPILDALISEDHSDSAGEIPDLFDRRALQEYILLISQEQSPPSPLKRPKSAKTSKSSRPTSKQIEEDKLGGLRDKPDTDPDPYHTHYVLAGLSNAQHYPTFSAAKAARVARGFKPIDISAQQKQSRAIVLGSNESWEEGTRRMKDFYSRAMGWDVDPGRKIILGAKENELLPVHPIFAVRPEIVKDIMDYFYHQ